MCLQNQPLQNQPNLLRELFKTETSLDQYRKDLREAQDKKDVMLIGYRHMIVKYTAYAHASSCTTVKLICSNIVQDLKNTLAVAEGTAAEIINQNNS